MEFLTHCHGNSILQFGAPHLYDLEIGIAFHSEGGCEFLQLIDQFVIPQQDRHLDRCWIRIVGGLRHVQVIVRVQELILTLAVTG